MSFADHEDYKAEKVAEPLCAVCGHTEEDHSLYAFRPLEPKLVPRAWEKGNAMLGIKDEPKPEPAKQSPMYQDAARILDEIAKLNYPHSRILALMNWKLRTIHGNF